MAETRDSIISRDMLQRFTCGVGNSFPVKPKEEAHGQPENIELSLGLSLNGIFGVKPEKYLVNNDNNNYKKICRASSVNDFTNFPVDVELSLYSPLARTYSVPAETEVGLLKRKELQSLRRSEVKRKRVEKLKNMRVVKGKSYEIELSGLSSKQSSPAPPQSLSALQFSSQGSIVSQGSGGSSGISDLDSQPVQGIKKDTGKPHESSTSNNGDCPTKIEPKVDCTNVDTMPCVSTRGGPDGRRIQGFLYRYGKGEEVRIVCVCHGSFLTPAEFVKHGGGGEVEHPLRHIIITPCSASV